MRKIPSYIPPKDLFEQVTEDLQIVRASVDMSDAGLARAAKRLSRNLMRMRAAIPHHHPDENDQVSLDAEVTSILASFSDGNETVNKHKALNQFDSQFFESIQDKAFNEALANALLNRFGDSSNPLWTEIAGRIHADY